MKEVFVVMGAHPFSSLQTKGDEEPLRIEGDPKPCHFMPVFGSMEDAKRFSAGRFDVLTCEIPDS